MKLFRNIVIATLILNTLGSTLIIPLIYLDFSLRREYIAKVLCIKKEEPITVCGGQCYLADRLEKAAEQQQKESTTVNAKVQFSFFSQPVTSISFDPFNAYIITNHSPTQNLNLSSAYYADIFHPPKTA